MGSGGVRASCQSTLCILAGIALGVSLLCALGGGILYGVSAGLTKVSDVHLVNTTTASNFSKSVDSKLDNIRESSAETGESLMQKAHHMFYAAAAFGIGTVLFLILSCVVAYKSQPTLAPPVVLPPADGETAPLAPPAEDPERGGSSPVPPSEADPTPGSPPLGPLPGTADEPKV